MHIVYPLDELQIDCRDENFSVWYLFFHITKVIFFTVDKRMIPLILLWRGFIFRNDAEKRTMKK